MTEHALPDFTIPELGSASNVVLLGTLEVAVPLWHERWRDRPFEERAARARQCAEEVAAHGDRILFRSKGTAEAFNRLGEGLGILSMQPGGVRFAGHHWVDGRSRSD